MMELNTAWQLGAALGLGMLIGLERERTRGDEQTFAGVRTFSLVAIWLGAPAMRRTMIPITVALALSGVAAAYLVG